jgi:hypothetical protein
MVIDFDKLLGILKDLQMKVDTLEMARLTISAPSGNSSPWQLGRNYLIRTVTMINTGRLVQVFDQELVLEDAAWIADTGRFADSLKSCNFSEVEPFPDGKVIIGRGSVIDAVQIDSLPRKQK